MNCTFEKPNPTPISCCAPLPSDQAKPQAPAAGASSELQTARLVEMLPKEVRDAIMREAEKIEQTRRQSNALAAYVSNLKDVPPSAASSGGDSSPVAEAKLMTPPSPPPADAAPPTTTPPPPKETPPPASSPSDPPAAPNAEK